MISKWPRITHSVRLNPPRTEGTGSTLWALRYQPTIETCRRSFRTKLRRHNLTPKQIQDYLKGDNTPFGAITSRDGGIVSLSMTCVNDSIFVVSA
ncbi:hypothetical protein [Roseovarius litorisediminis]|uniref:hypothetical protein n=1 Tax=Roseovarius litorisediminis TaxID=1312363 RepID=UPI000A26D67F|nr:hypothetical protein [Roseovarius litorisediminis]